MLIWKMWWNATLVFFKKSWALISLWWWWFVNLFLNKNIFVLVGIKQIFINSKAVYGGQERANVDGKRKIRLKLGQKSLFVLLYQNHEKLHFHKFFWLIFCLIVVNVDNECAPIRINHDPFLYWVDKKTNMIENRSIDCCYLIFTLTQLKTKKKNYP